MKLTLDNKEQVILVGKALSSEVRIDILKLLKKGDRNINEIAELLQIPQSSAVSHIKVLEECGFIQTELVPGVRGNMKLCHIIGESVTVTMEMKIEEDFEIISMPIGHFVDYYVEPTCGIASEKNRIGEEDEPRCFFEPDRVQAQIIWLGCGYLEYRFPNHQLIEKKIKEIQISAEVCSEDHDYNMEYPSDITLWVNGKEVGTWTCPSDFGGRRGKNNPIWWPDKNTQYGMLKTWRITNEGSYIDEESCSNQTIETYQLLKEPYICVRIGVKQDAINKGGMNLFGEAFGDYKQNLVMKIIYDTK